jgi:hypothetical protein
MIKRRYSKIFKKEKPEKRWHGSILGNHMISGNRRAF